ncbi:DNA polymerase IV [Sphaerisporangium sp. NBC_01403]|uniref:DNA polymerase IV n=1 Tax=Sphaerisporangium sp. NBC_01403 TaxID=2903599 RepID=UPI003864F08F
MSRKQVLRSEPGQGHGPGRAPLADDTGCPILHVDMDAFFAGVELLDRPELKGTPVIIGATGARGVVLSATYEARAYGVHSAMPMTRARRLCPQAVVIPPSHGKYSAVSKGVMEIFHAITPEVEPIASDEAFLDVGGALRRLGPPAEIAALIRAQVAERHGITCSVGVASSKFVAKLASRHCKPDGLLVVPAAGVVEFLHPLPVAALWGVGERTEQALVRLGIKTVGDLAHVPPSTLQREFGAVGAHLAALAWGRDDRRVTPHVPDKSIGAEETFSHDVDDPEAIRRELLRLSERVAARLRGGGHVGRTVSVKLRRSDFTTITRSRTLREATDVAKEIYATACDLYGAAGLDRVRLRLVGVRVENLRPAGTATRQLGLGERETGWREAEMAMDKAMRRFGPEAVRPASLVRPPFDGIDL